MINRYKVKEISDIWSEENKYKNWLNLEILVCEALNELNIIPNKDLEEIKKEAKYNIDEILDLEKQTKHDVVAFCRNISSYIKSNSKKWIHFGLTSTDLVDSSNGINFKLSNEIIIKDTLELLEVLKKISIENKYKKQIARTHGVHAQINSLGLKFLNYFENVKLWLKEFNNIKEFVEVIKLSGAVGNYSFSNPLIEEIVSKKLGLKIAINSTQVISRNKHAIYLNYLNNLGLIINSIATEIRHLHRTEVNEICESFSENQKGSSAMPHKKNPVTCENICGMSRLLNSYSIVSNDNINLWHERDISHSSNERIIFEDSINILVYLIRKIKEVLSGIKINYENIEKNITLTNNKNISQAILLHLIKYSDDSREEIYDTIQKLTFENEDLLKAIKTSKYSKLFENDYLEKFKEDSNELKYIDYIFNRTLKNEK